MSLFKPRATLGQRQFLIKPKIHINIQQFSGKITPPQYKQTNKTQHTQAAALHPDGTGRRVSSGLLPDVRIRRTQMPVGRTIPSTGHGETTERRADVPLGDGDRDRDVAHSRSDWLSSRSSTTASTRLHCRPTVPVPVCPADPIDTHSCCCLRRRPRRQPTYPGSRLVRRADAAPCVPLTTAHWNRSSQQPAAAALTMRSSTSPHTVYQTLRYHT